MNDLDHAVILTQQIRDIQARHGTAHEALMNWGAWSRDRKQIGPKHSRCRIFDQYRYSYRDGYDAEPVEAVEEAPVKAEPLAQEPYDEKSGALLDERIHSSGGLSSSLRQLVKIAYVSRETPEHLFHRYAGCTHDAFCERLIESLKFVARFV